MLIGEVWVNPGSANELAALMGVHRTTVQRWIDRKELPAPVYQLLLIRQHGKLGQLHDAWAGWSIDTRRGDLVTPVGDTILPAQILSVPYRLHQLAELQRKLSTLDRRPSNPLQNAPGHARVQSVNADD